METNKERVERLYKECRMEAFQSMNEVHPQGHPARRFSSIYASIDAMDDNEMIRVSSVKNLLHQLRLMESMLTAEEEAKITDGRCQWTTEYIKAFAELHNSA